MKKILFVLFVLGISLSVHAELKPKNLVGKWKYEVDTGGQYLTGYFKFVEKDGKLTGEVVSDDGYDMTFSKIEFKEDNKVHLEAKTDYDVVKVDVKFEGDKFSGMASNSEGEAPISGKKVNQ